MTALMPALRLGEIGSGYEGMARCWTFERVGRFDGWPPSPVGRRAQWAWPRRDGCIGSPGGSLLMCQSGGLTGLIGGGAKVNQAATA